MESHSYSGLNTHGASFLQELTVDETGKDVFGKSQEQQPRAYSSFPDPQVGSYPDLSSESYYNGRCNPDTYYYGQPQYLPRHGERSKYAENPFPQHSAMVAQTVPHSSVVPKTLPGPHTASSSHWDTGVAGEIPLDVGSCMPKPPFRPGIPMPNITYSTHHQAPIHDAPTVPSHCDSYMNQSHSTLQSDFNNTERTLPFRQNFSATQSTPLRNPVSVNGGSAQRYTENNEAGLTYSSLSTPAGRLTPSKMHPRSQKCLTRNAPKNRSNLSPDVPGNTPSSTSLADAQTFDAGNTKSLLSPTGAMFHHPIEVPQKYMRSEFQTESAQCRVPSALENLTRMLPTESPECGTRKCPDPERNKPSSSSPTINHYPHSHSMGSISPSESLTRNTCSDISSRISHLSPRGGPSDSANGTFGCPPEGRLSSLSSATAGVNFRSGLTCVTSVAPYDRGAQLHSPSEWADPVSRKSDSSHSPFSTNVSPETMARPRAGNGIPDVSISGSPYSTGTCCPQQHYRRTHGLPSHHTPPLVSPLTTASTATSNDLVCTASASMKTLDAPSSPTPGFAPSFAQNQTNLPLLRRESSMHSNTPESPTSEASRQQALRKARNERRRLSRQRKRELEMKSGTSKSPSGPDGSRLQRLPQTAEKPPSLDPISQQEPIKSETPRKGRSSARKPAGTPVPKKPKRSTQRKVKEIAGFELTEDTQNVGLDADLDAITTTDDKASLSTPDLKRKQSDSSSQLEASDAKAEEDALLPKRPRPPRPRPPRRKKKRPLRSLLKKKRRCAYYGEDSDSGSDVSSRFSERRSGSGFRKVKSSADLSNSVQISADLADESFSSNRASVAISSTRRSERNTGDRKKYNIDSVDFGLSDEDEDSEGSEAPTTGRGRSDAVDEASTCKVVEKILGRRMSTRAVLRSNEKGTTAANGEKEEVEPSQEGEADEVEEDVEEFYVKYKGLSYMHCEWKPVDEIQDPRFSIKLKKFLAKGTRENFDEDEEVVLFNPDYVEVERVLDVNIYNRQGELITEDVLNNRRLNTTGELHPAEIKRQAKRERERKRARALRAAKLRARQVDSAAVASSNLDESATPNTEEAETDSLPTEPTPVASTPPPVTKNAPDLLIAAPAISEPATDSSASEAVDPPTTRNAPSATDAFQSSPIATAGEDEATANGSDITSPQAAPDKPDDDSTTPEPNALPESADKGVQETRSEEEGEIDSRAEAGQDFEDDGSQPATISYYLVKWRSLPYEDATWELAEDVDPSKVKEFMRHRNPPKDVPVLRDSNYSIIRPDPSLWRPITDDAEYKNANKLREYQVEGVNWLTFCWYNKRNCILADEMGLGKTVQSIAFLLEVFAAGVKGPFLIIVPLSTVGNWQREFENWSDLNVVVYHGSGISRRMIQDYEIFYRKKGSSHGGSQYRHDVYKFHALITTFEILMSDIEFFGKIHWAVAIIDEAHRLKNKKCKLGEGLRYLELDHRVLLTGTPLQNNVEELFGLLNFLEPERFSCASTFLAEYGELKTEAQVEDLKSLLKPMMLRRLKEDVEKTLAPKEETIIEVELTNLQKKYYRAIMERNFSFLCKGTTGTNMPNLMNVMMELRKCCNHPFLIKGAEEAIHNEERAIAEADPNCTYNEEQAMFNALLNASGKLVLIHKLLPKLKAGGHKVLIFSQMIRVLDILEDYLVHQGFSFERIDGRIHGLLRQEAIDRFCNDPDKFVFLLCTKAGGLGINLTAADVVIIYDSDWNPQNDLQAQARCHRIGQQKMVKVYRLITRNTYEREMFDRASLKLGLDRAVLQSMGSKEARQAQLGKKEVEDLLKKGAYGALMEDDKAGDEFCEEDIDQILQSRSHVIQLEQGEKNSTFSKATFSISDTRNDISLDDPDFWQKWAKKAGVEEASLEFEDLILKTPRQRRQTSRYTAELNEQVSNASHSQNTNNLRGAFASSQLDTSEAENSSNADSSGDDDNGSVSRGNNGKGASGNCRKHNRRRSKRHGLPRSASALADGPWTEGGAGQGEDSGLGQSGIESVDRADLFRVEKCLFTWGWGRWQIALQSMPFKRAFTPVELEQVARAILNYTLRIILPSGGDARIRTVLSEMISVQDPSVLRPIAEIVQALRSATNSAIRAQSPALSGSRSTSLPIRSCFGPSRRGRGRGGGRGSNAGHLSFGCTGGRTGFSTSLPNGDSPTLSTPATPLTPLEVEGDARMGPLVPAVTTEHDEQPMELQPTESTVQEIDAVKTEPSDVLETPMTAVKPVEEDGEENVKPPDECEPKQEDEGTCGKDDADYGISSESFKRHLHRAGGRLLARVYTLFFLHSEIVGLELADRLCDGEVDHTAFSQLADSLPPLKALDADVPADWWDSCCDKCLLLGVFKHGWEKYLAIRDDPNLCFYRRVYGDQPVSATGKHTAGELARPQPNQHDHRTEATAVGTADEGEEQEGEEGGEDDDDDRQGAPNLGEAQPSVAEDSRQPTGEDPKSDAEAPHKDSSPNSPFADGGPPALEAQKHISTDTTTATEVDESSQAGAAVDAHLSSAESPSDDRHRKSPFSKETEGSSPLARKPADPTLPALVDEEGDLEQRPVELPQPLLLFPAIVDLNSRMRKLIAYFQRVRNQVELEVVQHQRAEYLPTVTAQPYMEQRLIKWSRREEADFYRVVSSYGVEQVMKVADPAADPGCSPQRKRSPKKRVFAGYNWNNFKQLANLAKKSDQAITEYYNSFFTMCHRVCKKKLPEAFPEAVCSLPTTTTYGSCQANKEVPVAPISEERATRTLSRIELLNRIRNTVLSHPLLEERLAMCQRSSDLPEWWIPGRHDGELLRAAAKHGLARTDLNILPDKDFSFSRVAALIQRQLMKEPGALTSAPSPSTSTVAALSCGFGEVEQQQRAGLHLSEVAARASLAAAATSAARAVAAVLEAKIAASGQSNTVSPVKIEESKRMSKSETVKPEAPVDSFGADNLAKTLQSDEALSSASKIEDDKTGGPALGCMPSLSSPSVDQSTSPCRATRAGDSSLGEISTSSEQFAWSLKFATNLALAWPKDRTIHNRLDMVCQCVETGHWPVPRRYVLNPSGSAELCPLSASGGSHVSSTTPSTPDTKPSPSSLAATRTETSADADADITCCPSPNTILSLPTGRSLDDKASLPAGTEAALSALKAAGYTSVEQVLALQAAAAAAAGHRTLPVDASAATLFRQHNTAVGVASSSLLPPSSCTTPTGRGGRGGRGSRGGRGGRGGAGYSALRQSASDETGFSVASLAKGPPTTGRGRRGAAAAASAHYLSSAGTTNTGLEATRTMPPPNATQVRSTRGRKRKFDSTNGRISATSAYDGRSSSKRERSEHQLTGSSCLPPPDSSAWDVHVPLISLVNGSLIHGDKAPKRRNLEVWLENHPEYMPYSVEPEDQVIFNRVAKSRGQDTSAMEALAYRHYVTSLFNNAAAAAAASTSTSSPAFGSFQQQTASSIQAKQQGAFATSGPADILDQQQKQLLAIAAAAYSGHPAYANLLASALGYTSASASCRQGESASSTSTTATSSPSHTLTGESAVPIPPSTPPTLTQPEINNPLASSARESESSSKPSRPSSKTVCESESSPGPHSRSPSVSEAATPAGATPSSSLGLGAAGCAGLESMLAAYQQAASFAAAAYMYSPSLYSQLFGGASTSAATPSDPTAAAKLQQKLLQQQQQAALAASALASATDVSSLLALFAGAASGSGLPVAAAAAAAAAAASSNNPSNSGEDRAAVPRTVAPSVSEQPAPRSPPAALAESPHHGGDHSPGITEQDKSDSPDALDLSRQE
ncbi:choline dehydrogenase 7 [Sparganum proliferum]